MQPGGNTMPAHATQYQILQWATATVSVIQWNGSLVLVYREARMYWEQQCRPAYLVVAILKTPKNDYILDIHCSKLLKGHQFILHRDEKGVHKICCSAALKVATLCAVGDRQQRTFSGFGGAFGISTVSKSVIPTWALCHSSLYALEMQENTALNPGDMLDASSDAHISSTQAPNYNKS